MKKVLTHLATLVSRLFRPARSRPVAPAFSALALHGRIVATTQRPHAPRITEPTAPPFSPAA
jgi:hypothetical protein